MKDPFTSRATKEARAAEAARTIKLRWIIGGMIVFVLVLLAGIYFITFAGGPKSSASGDKVAPETEARQELNNLNVQIEDCNTNLADTKMSADMKSVVKNNKAAFEKRRKEILALHPDWR